MYPMSRIMRPALAAWLFMGLLRPLEAGPETPGPPSPPAPGEVGDAIVSPSSPPPIPLSTEREKRIMDAVFSRFPDVEPGLVMDYLRNHFPHEVRYFTELSMRDVERSVEYLTRVVGDCAQLLQTQKTDPDRYDKLLALQKLELKAYSQSDAFKASGNDERQARHDELMATLDDCFEIKQYLMRKELTDLEEELVKLREMIEKREETKLAILHRRFLQITGEKDGLEW